MPDKAIEVLLDEKRNLPPPKRSRNRPTQEARVFLIRRVKIPKVANMKWSVGGKLSASYNCLDRHIKRMRDLTDTAFLRCLCNKARG
jgi:hypothetical protein